VATKYPIRYELTPQRISEGMQWLVLKLQNIGDQELTNLDVRLNSLDTYALRVQGTGSHLAELLPNSVEEVSVQVLALARGRLYVSVSGWKAMRLFHWESGEIVIQVGAERAVVASLSVIGGPSPTVGEPLRCEVTVEGFAERDQISLELSVGKPDGTFAELLDKEIEGVAPGESRAYTAELTPDQEGAYTIYARLLDEGKRIDREVQRIHVKPV